MLYLDLAVFAAVPLAFFAFLFWIVRRRREEMKASSQLSNSEHNRH